MVKIGDVWDSTTDVLAGRAALLAPFVAGALVLPGLVQAALTGLAPGSSGLAGLLMIATALIALWGRLAITAIAMDPDTDAGAARSQATRGLPRLLGALLVLGAAAIVLFVPVFYAMTAAGFDWAALGEGRRPAMVALGPGANLYVVGLLALALWANARIRLLLTPVILAERRTVGAIGRAVNLTRGLTLKLIAVVILYYGVLLVCGLAVGIVFGSVFRLILPPGVAAFIGAALGVVVTALFDTVAHVFGARLYALLAVSPTTAPA